MVNQVPNLGFLTIINEQEAIPHITDLLDRCQQQLGFTIDPEFVGWNAVWHELVNISIYHRDIHVAEVGTTWLESLVAMNALRPFSPTEIARLGGKSAHLPITWEGTSLNGQVWGVPLRSDVRVIWYWKDMLEEAGVAPDTAFAGISNMQVTLEKLKSVVDTPLGISTAAGDPNSIQTLATWLWAFGADFVTPKCDKVLLLEPEALEALRAYFSLYRYMPKDSIYFTQRNVAAIFAGPWMLSTFSRLGFSDEEFSRIGVAVPPGPPFVGGTVLSIWQHTARSRLVDNAFKFIEFITQPEVQIEYSPHSPTRQEAWDVLSKRGSPYYKTMRKALAMGRSFPAVPLWGMVEEKLKTSISLIWKDLLTNPDTNVDLAIEKYLEPTVKRLNLSLK
jgi:multiple sugar transport system substrate-binding protein